MDSQRARSLNRGRSSSYRGKRLLDLVLVLGTSPLWLPLFAFVVVAVRIALGSPIFFRQTRVGLHDQLFVLMKFRTMTDARDEAGNHLPDDQRLTPFGRLLRRSSIDELPELFNVLRGEMSLVGPRPLLVEYLPRYSMIHRQRHLVRPGITGLAQISGRNNLEWPSRFDFDVRYAHSNSLGSDLRILARTVRTVLSRRDINADGHSTMTKFAGYSSENECDH